MKNQAHRILVVDDELGMREGCRKVLKSEGYEVETAEDGIAALELFKEKKEFAAALIDLKMPKMGGMELIEEIKKYDKDIVLFVITAYAAIDTAVEATKKGAYGYIPKPFTPDELLLPIKNGLEKRELSLRARKLQEERDEKLHEVAYERSKGSTIIKCMSDGVVVVNRDGKIVLTNATVNRFFPEFTNIPHLSPLTSLGYADLESLLSETLSTDYTPTILSKEIFRGERTYMVNASPLVKDGGEILGAVAVLRDISELKKLETVKASFISMVSHEVSSHLGAIEGYVNLILSDETNDMTDDYKNMMERINIRARALRTMVSDLVDLSAIETGNFSIKRLPVDIQNIVHEAIQICSEKAEKKQIELSYNGDALSGKVKVLADYDALVTIFRNLLDNAVKYTHDGGHVSVRIEDDTKYIKVIVSDDGIGMTPEEKEKIFEEFYRVRNKNTAHITGSGLGLNIVKRMVDLHEGDISVTTEAGMGSVFTVSLPKIKRDNSYLKNKKEAKQEAGAERINV